MKLPQRNAPNKGGKFNCTHIFYFKFNCAHICNFKFNCAHTVTGIVAKKRDPGILDPELFLAQIRKVETD